MDYKEAAAQVKEALKEDIPIVKEEKKDGLILEANKAAERLEKANAELKILLDHQEEILAREKLGGKSQAGVVPVEKSETDKQKDEINNFLKQTGLRIN